MTDNNNIESTRDETPEQFLGRLGLLPDDLLNTLTEGLTLDDGSVVKLIDDDDDDDNDDGTPLAGEFLISQEEIDDMVMGVGDNPLTFDDDDVQDQLRDLKSEIARLETMI
jgi:hypothetical protein